MCEFRKAFADELNALAGRIEERTKVVGLTPPEQAELSQQASVIAELVTAIERGGVIVISTFGSKTPAFKQLRRRRSQKKR